MLSHALQLPRTLQVQRPWCARGFAIRSKSLPDRICLKISQAPLKTLRGASLAIGDKARTETMGKARKAASQGNANTQAYIQVLGLGTDTGDSAPSALLFFDHHRFLFNVGEGFQRFCIQHKIRMSRTSGIFATRSNTQGLGGLPGMLLTMADMGAGTGTLGTSGVPMTLHGPPGLKAMTNALRSFVNTRDMSLKDSEFGTLAPPVEGAPELQPVLKNDVVTVTPALLYPAAQSAESEDKQPHAKRRRVDAAPASSTIASNDNSVTDGEVVEGCGRLPAACYLCKLPDIPGKFQLEKAEALGVPRGPLYAKLVRGETIELPSGRTVVPADVLEPSTEGPLAAVIDVPTLEHLPSLLSHPVLGRCLNTPSGDEANGPTISSDSGGASREPESTAIPSRAFDTQQHVPPVTPLHVAVHLTPKAVTDDPRYRAWMAGCGDRTQHIMANVVAPGEGPAMLRSSAAIHARLNLLAPLLFPLTGEGDPDRLQPVDTDAEAGRQAGQGSSYGGNVAAGHNLLRHWLRPVARQGLDLEAVAKEPFDHRQVQAELRESRPEVLAAAEGFNDPLQAEEATAVPPEITAAGRDTMEVVFLGTGAAIPAKYRNVTGIYVHLFSRGGMMLDCGEGSFGQLVRKYGWQGARKVVAALECVWISHIHADHHAGLPRLLAVRQEILGEKAQPLLVIGPRPLRRSLACYANTEPLLFTYLDNAHTVEGAEVPEAAAPHLQAAMERLGLARLQSVKVEHCAHAYGCALTATTAASGGKPWSLVFSGDTRPCAALVKAAKGATVLIHEATFDDELVEEAVAKKHSLTSEAVACGRDAGAYRTILTHFSQRYAKLPVIDDSFQASTCIAFDLMTANLADLPAMPRLLPALQLLFKEDEEDAAEDEECTRDDAPFPTVQT